MCISLSKPYISVADNAWHCYKNQKFMATFSQFQQPLENPVHWGSSRRLVENGELPRRLFLLSVVYGRTWQAHALLLSSVITCAMYSVCDYVLHRIVYFLMPFSVLPSSLLGPAVSGEEPHVYTQVLCCASAMPPPFSSLLTFQSFFFQPCWCFWHWLSSWFCGRSWVTHKFGD